MKIDYCVQQSPEWFALHKGKIGGTRFGQATSSRENRLMYDLLDEIMNENLFPDDYVSEEMQFGIDNEPIARDMYIKTSGIQFEEVGSILSDFSDIHMASPDGIIDGIVLEIKCTESGAIHIQRYFKGPEQAHMPQVINYFAVSDEIKEVHWVSYCPNRKERELVVKVFTRDSIVKDGRKESTIQQLVIEGRKEISRIEFELNVMYNQFIF